MTPSNFGVQDRHGPRSSLARVASPCAIFLTDALPGAAR